MLPQTPSTIGSPAISTPGCKTNSSLKVEPLNTYALTTSRLTVTSAPNTELRPIPKHTITATRLAAAIFLVVSTAFPSLFKCCSNYPTEYKRINARYHLPNLRWQIGQILCHYSNIHGSKPLLHSLSSTGYTCSGIDTRGTVAPLQMQSSGLIRGHGLINVPVSSQGLHYVMLYCETQLY